MLFMIMVMSRLTFISRNKITIVMHFCPSSGYFKDKFLKQLKEGWYKRLNSITNTIKKCKKYFITKQVYFYHGT